MNNTKIDPWCGYCGSFIKSQYTAPMDTEELGVTLTHVKNPSFQKLESLNENLWNHSYMS